VTKLILSFVRLKLPEVAVASDVDEALHGSSVVPVVEEDRRGDFVPVPGVVGMVIGSDL